MTHKQRDLLQQLHDLGGRIKFEEHGLTFLSPHGTMTPELRAALREWAPDLFREHRERKGILLYDARQSSD